MDSRGLSDHLRSARGEEEEEEEGSAKLWLGVYLTGMARKQEEGAVKKAIALLELDSADRGCECLRFWPLSSAGGLLSSHVCGVGKAPPSRFIHERASFVALYSCPRHSTRC